MNINFREASTKRGIVMVVTGCITLYNIMFGTGASDIDVLMHRVEWWIGIGITIVGMLGFLPDQPVRDPQERTRETDSPKDIYIPQISLVGRSESVVEASDSNSPSHYSDGFADPDLDQLYRDRVCAIREAQNPEQSVRQDGGGYNG